MITPAPVISQRELERRIDLTSYLGGVFSSLGSDVSSFVASGVPQFFNDLPTGTAVLSSVGIQSSDLDASPTHALMVPPYANWTEQGWNVRLHGNIYKQPNISTDKLNSLANGFLIDTDITSLPADEQDQARNLTSEIYVEQQDNEQVIINVVQNVAVNPAHDSGAINAAGGAQDITMPSNTTAEGDFDAFVLLQNTTGTNGSYLMPGNETDHLQLLNVYVQGAAETGNATAFLVPSTGITIISDIDDILRESFFLCEGNTSLTQTIQVSRRFGIPRRAFSTRLRSLSPNIRTCLRSMQIGQSRFRTYTSTTSPPLRNR